VDSERWNDRVEKSDGFTRFATAVDSGFSPISNRYSGGNRNRRKLHETEGEMISNRYRFAFFSVARKPSRACLLALVLIPFAALAPLAQTQALNETIEIDAQAPAQPFPHFWERMFGSGRAILSLRESYRSDLRQVHQATGFEYVRFHNIFHDEVGLYDEDASGNPVYNFSYVDQIYDGLLQNGVRPYVELSFMPSKLAAQQTEQSFWYHPVVSPPKDPAKWAALITRFAQHLIDRYGIEEVSQWYFEVWNEPNLDFWAGDPKEQTYYQLYDTTARALKAVNPRLRVGGPATAQAAWVDRFIRHCVENRVPLDFVSTHVYGNDLAKDVFGTDENIPRTAMVCRAAAKVHDQVKASALPNIPIFWSEYNASYKNEPDVTDAVFLGAWLADTIRQCDGLTDMMSYWTFSDVFEEQGVVKQPIYGGYGIIAEDGLPKPAFNAFRLLHSLGDRRIAIDSKSALVTRRPDGTLVIAAWNLFLPEQAGEPKEITLAIKGVKANARLSISRLDSRHGSLLDSYGAMGQPVYPTPAQIQQLRRAAMLPPPQAARLDHGKITLTLPPQGLVLLETR
jgi:xylan 1,4-beta-xylosidase